jgi:thiamine-phosphate pyrophosphorylase
MRKAPDGLDLFYPIVPDVAWLKRLVPLGVRTIQLRLKDAPPERVRREISDSLELCRQYRCQLIVNDYWREALDLGADYVHLGQEDLAAADLAAIRAKGVRLGISTHSPDELDIALAAKPAYVALGPIYETRLKVMKWAPQGLARIVDWKMRIGDLPLVAIGGITPKRALGVVIAGADSIAVITDFFTNPDPEARVREWLAWAATLR